MWGCARRINTTWANLQIEKHKSGRRSFRSPDWFVLFELQIFSGGVYPLSATSRTISFFLFTTVFSIRDVLQTEIRKLRRKRAAAGWEVRNKMAHFRENPSERSARGPWNRTKFSVRFSLAGSSLPMWPCASAVWDCRMPHQLLLSFCLFFSYVIIFEIVELHSVNFVFSSCIIFFSSEVQAITKPSISPSEGVVTREKAWKSAFCS